jgi:hypothetical protein
MSLGVFDNSSENEKAIERFKDAKRTGMVRPHQKSSDAKGSIKAYLDKLSGPKRFSEGHLTRNQGVNQCRFGAGGDIVIGPNSIPCGYGVLLPQEMSGLVEATNLRKNDAVLFKVNLILPTVPANSDTVGMLKDFSAYNQKAGLWNQIEHVEKMAQYFYFTEGQVEGVVEEAHPNSSLLGGEGIVYKVIPTSTRLSKDAQDSFSTDPQNGARDALRGNTGITTVGVLNKHVIENYIPLKIGKLPIVYWVGVYNDMQTAQVVVTTNYVTYKQLEENLYTQAARVILGAYPVTELTHEKSRIVKSSSSRTR